MICFMCKGNLQDGFSTFTADIDGCIVVIKNVPSRICAQCGEVSYSGTVASQLEKMIDRFASSTGAEVSVINFEKSVA